MKLLNKSSTKQPNSGSGLPMMKILTVLFMVLPLFTDKSLIDPIITLLQSTGLVKKNKKKFQIKTLFRKKKDTGNYFNDLILNYLLNTYIYPSAIFKILSILRVILLLVFIMNILGIGPKRDQRKNKAWNVLYVISELYFRVNKFGLFQDQSDDEVTNDRLVQRGINSVLEGASTGSKYSKHVGWCYQLFRSLIDSDGDYAGSLVHVANSMVDEQNSNKKAKKLVNLFKSKK